MVNEETGQAGRSVLELVLIPLFRLIMRVVQLAQWFSPVNALSTGRSIPWEYVGLAFLQIVVLLGGVLAVAGVWLFSRRELAAVQSNS